MSEILDAFRAGVALDLMTLAQLHDRELDAAGTAALKQERFPTSLALQLESERGVQAVDMLTGVVAAMVQTPDDDLAADFAAIYLTHGIGASPCESVWLDDDGLAMQQPMFEVREAYARRGLQAPDWRKRPDDHLVFQLQFVAMLIEQPADTALADAAAFLDWHTLRWLPQFAERVAQRAATPFYAGLAMLTAVYIDELRDLLARILDAPRPTPQEIEQRSRDVQEVPLPMPGAYVPGNSPSW